jgi:gamma-glutamyltranspeptidase/glutathione hydrolase
MNPRHFRTLTATSLFVVALSFAPACSTSSHSGPQPTGAAASPELNWSGAPQSEQESRYRPKVGTRGMVVADDAIAAEWGAEILRQGGNAVDAAVATAFAMSVTRPHFGSLGGGGFMVYCPKPNAQGKQKCQALDYREEAPSAASRDMYLRNGKGDTDLSQNGALASGVPGVVSGLLTALKSYGSLPARKLLTRPIELAHQGFKFTGYEEATAQERWKNFNDEAKRLFGCVTPESKVRVACPPGTVIKQPELARVLEEISRRGAPGFYDGWVASKIVEGLKASGGILSREDLLSYHAKWRKPVSATFRGMEVVSMPPPSAGGTVLLQMLGYAERADAQGALDQGYGAASSVHAIGHGMALAYADRAKFFGDPDQVKVPTEEMLSKAYLDLRWKSFDPSREVLPTSAGNIQMAPEGQHTTHFSVIDREGNAVGITTTINDNYGSGFVPPGTGVVMNNEMDDFSIQPGLPNLFGLVGDEANAIAPHKRPLSSMSPTIVRDEKGIARIVIGAAGGPRITTSVYLSLLNRLKFNMSLVDAVAAPRIHQQWKPEELKLERQGFSEDTRERLGKMGWKLKESASLARVHALERFPNGRVWGAPDFRGEGTAVAE